MKPIVQDDLIEDQFYIFAILPPMYILFQTPMKSSITLRLIFSAFILVFGSLSAQAQKGTLNDLKFLEGRWLGTFNGGPIEAGWSAPAADNIIGYIRMMKDNKPTMYELFVFEQTDKGPVAMVKHYKPGMVALEEKDKHDHYLFQSAKKNEALFEKEDASVRIIYERRSPTQLVIRRGSKKDADWTFVDLFVFEKMP